jgi:CheY-like chemotaxis protein
MSAVLMVDLEMMLAAHRFYRVGELPRLSGGEGVDGLAVLRGAQAQIVIADVSMPRMNGLQLATEVATRPPCR